VIDHDFQPEHVPLWVTTDELPGKNLLFTLELSQARLVMPQLMVLLSA